MRYCSSLSLDAILYAIERVVALFAYTAQHSDELSFKKDDIITILERGADPDWWKGELDGRSGLFPANYIRPLTTGDCMLLCTPICTSYVIVLFYNHTSAITCTQSGVIVGRLTLLKL